MVVAGRSVAVDGTPVAVELGRTVVVAVALGGTVVVAVRGTDGQRCPVGEANGVGVGPVRGTRRTAPTSPVLSEP